MENKELNELLIQRQNMLTVDISDKYFDKLKGEEPAAGSRCEIIWNEWDTYYPDSGYLFDLPIGNASDEADIFIHIPKPQNPDGMDTSEPVFLHLYALITNDQVKSITILK